MPVTIATRKSPLARKQTELVVDWIMERSQGCETEILPLSTQVDERLNWSLEKRGGLGLFTKELENALLQGDAELAVHSAKDLPTTLPDGLCIAGYLPRGNPQDMLVLRKGAEADPKTIATSSPRRRNQLKQRFPDAEWTNIRGNVSTRLRKIQEGVADASILACAGLDRLNITCHEGLVFESLPVASMVPAPGQAAIAIECRAADLPKYQGLFCEQTRQAVELERAFLRGLGSGCQTPFGVYFAEGTLHLYHPKCGYLNQALELPADVNLAPLVDQLLNDLNLLEANG